jgi:hypothetical protein
MKKTTSKKPSTLRAPMSIRFTDDERMAITKASEVEEREPAVLVRRIVLTWLKERGHLK